MRWMSMAVLAVTVPVAAAQAQRPSKVELGTMLGASLLEQNGDVQVVASAPGGGTYLGVLPVFYANFALTPHVSIEPQTYVAISADEVLVSGALQLGYLTAPQRRASPFFAAHGGIVHTTGQDAVFMVGGSLGYRFIASDALAIRVEGR